MKDTDSSFIKVVGPSFEEVVRLAGLIAAATGYRVDRSFQSERDGRYVSFLNKWEKGKEAG